MAKRKQAKINNSTENWESRKLGADQKFAKAVSPEDDAALDEALSMKPISIRMPVNLLETLKLIAKFHNVGYQPLIRDVLARFSKAELRDILQKLESVGDEELYESPAEGYFEDDDHPPKVAAGKH